MKPKTMLLSVLLYISYFMKSVWYATVSVLQMLVSLFIIGAAVIYFNVTGYINIDLVELQLMEVANIIFSFWPLFWTAFFFTKLWECIRYNMPYDEEEMEVEE